jgi:hypothetical protein
MRTQVGRLFGAVAIVIVGFLGPALAKPTSQQTCDKARLTAWKLYASCVERKVASDAGGVSFDERAAFARCRHAYFKKWTGFQPKNSLVGSTCIGNRFTDNGDGTVTDNLTELVWETKTDDDTVHDKDNIYSWASDPAYAGNGTSYTTFLETLNDGAGFAAANDWRLPTLAELQSIEFDFACAGPGGGPKCSCPLATCVAAALAPMQASSYWSAISYLPNPAGAWIVYFGGGDPGLDDKTNGVNVRAVRGGL